MSNVTTLDTTPAKVANKQPEVKSAVLKAPAGGDFSGARSMISIAPNPGDGGRDAVFVGVQGVGFQIPRGKQWEVPREVAVVLSSAVETIFENGQRVESPRYAFTRIDLE